jgi:hypothetical protein
MNLRIGWVHESPFDAASKLAGPTATASCRQSTGRHAAAFLIPHRTGPGIALSILGF